MYRHTDSQKPIVNSDSSLIHLLEAIRAFLPVLSPFGENAIKAYAELSGNEWWVPPTGFQPIDAQKIVEIGWPLAVLGPNESLH